MFAIDQKLRARTAVIVVALRQQLKDLERLADRDPASFARFARSARQCLRLHEELAEIWAVKTNTKKKENLEP